MSDILFENNTIVSSGKLILNSKINQIDFSGCDLINVNSFSGNNSAASTISSQNDNNIKLEPDGNGMIIANSTIQAPSFSGNDSADLTISSQSNQNIQLQPDGNGKIISNKTIQAPSFSGNDNNNDLIITTQNSNNIQLQPNGNGKIIADGTIQAPKLEIYNGSNTNEGIFSIITNTGTGTELCYLNIKSQGDDANIGFSSAGSKTLHITNVDDVYIASSGANLTISDQFTFNKTIQAPSFSGKASAALTISSQSNQNIQLQPNGNGKIIANKTIQAPKLEIYNGSNTNEGIFSHIANTDSTELCYLNIKSNGGGANIGFSSPGNKTLHITNNDNVYIASSGAILTISNQFTFNKTIQAPTFSGNDSAALTISSQSNQNIQLQPNGTGKIIASSTIQAPTFSGNDSAALTISSQSNQNIQLQPNGTGKIIASSTIQAPTFSDNGSDDLTIKTTKNNYNIKLKPNGSGKIIANKTIQAPKLEILDTSTTTNEGIYSYIDTTTSTVVGTVRNYADQCYLNIKSKGAGANIGFSAFNGTTLHITNDNDIYIAGGNSKFLKIQSNMTVTNNPFQAVSYSETSDYRIKTNIEELDENITVINLRPLMYLKEGKKEIGLIAHEIQEVFPFMVSGEKDGEKIQSVNYNNLIGVLINDVKRLTNENKNIKNENINIKSRLELLEDKFNKI